MLHPSNHIQYRFEERDRSQLPQVERADSRAKLNSDESNPATPLIPAPRTVSILDDVPFDSGL